MRAWILKKFKGVPREEVPLGYEALTEVVRDLFNTIGPEDILQVNSEGKWTLEGRPLSEGEQGLLIAEATQFLGMKLWKVLQDDIRYQANKKMFLLAENEMQIATGKLWLLTLDTFKTRLESLAKGSPHFNTK